MPDLPEQKRYKRVGSSRPEIGKLSFADAVRHFVYTERSGALAFLELFPDQFLLPPVQYFSVDLVTSDVRIDRINLGPDGHFVDVKDADYVMSSGIARMNVPYRGRLVDSGRRIVVLQSYLDENTYRQNREQVIHEIEEEKQRAKAILNNPTG